MTRRLSAVFLALLTSLALAAPASAATFFNYPDFSNTAGLQLNGDAKQEGNLIRLTPAEFDKAGSAFATTAINPQESWETQFQISMHDSSTSPLPADGMAFVVQSKGPQGGDGLGGSLGYGGIQPSVAVEFDIFENFFGGDPSGDHVAIMAEGDVGNHLACANEGGPSAPCSASLPFSIYGGPIHAWVEHDASTQRLKVFLSQTTEKPGAPLLDHQISLAPVGASAYAGFTAATGASTAVHDLLSWRFGKEEAAPVAPVAEKKKKVTKKCPPRRAKKGKKGKGKKAGASVSKAKKGKGKKGKGKKCGHKNKGKKGKRKGQKRG